MRVVRLCLLIALINILSNPTVHLIAQGQAQLSLQVDNPSLKTGQNYLVNIRISGINELWLTNIEITYDPAYLYVIGTKAGSPIKLGTFFSPSESVAEVRNSVLRDNLVYTASMLAPASPLNGAGIIGTFTIYPLAPGKTEIRFAKAELLKAIFATDEAGQRVAEKSEAIPFAPVLLQLDITGEKVEPPQEATATPIPSETPTPITGGGGVFRTEEPTLVNITAAPTTPTPEPTLATIALPTPSDTSSGLLLSLGAVIISALGLLVVLALWIRSRRAR